MEKNTIYTEAELIAEYKEDKRKFTQTALAGKATWGAWRYNPDNLTLEIDSKISGYSKDNPYYVDLEQCNSSDGVLNWLLQLLEKRWCSKEQVGYLLQAINDLAGDLHRVIGNRRFNMGKRLREMRMEGGEKLLKVEEVAGILSVKKITIYRWIGNGRLEAIRLPGGRGRGRDGVGAGEFRISKTEVEKLRIEHNSKTRGQVK